MSSAMLNFPFHISICNFPNVRDTNQSSMKGPWLANHLKIMYLLTHFEFDALQTTSASQQLLGKFLSEPLKTNCIKSLQLQLECSYVNVNLQIFKSSLKYFTAPPIVPFCSVTLYPLVVDSANNMTHFHCVFNHAIVILFRFGQFSCLPRSRD